MKLEILTFVILLCLTAVFSCDQNGSLTDGDIETDGESLANDGDLDNDGTDPDELNAVSFFCDNLKCRDGFTGLPECLLPDDTSVFEEINALENQCEEDSDCENGEICLYSQPQYICVDKTLPEWVAFYEWGGDCSWNESARFYTNCAVVAVFRDKGRIVLLEQCYDSDFARLCIDDVCVSTDSMDGKTVQAISNCDGKGTVIVLSDQTEYPPTLSAMRLVDNQLVHLATKEAQVNYWVHNYHWSQLECNSKGEMFWLTPKVINSVSQNKVTEIFSADSVENVDDYTYVHLSFDTMRVDKNDPDILHIGAANWAHSILLKIDIEDGLIYQQAREMVYSSVRSLATGDDYWLTGDINGFYKTTYNDNSEWLFKLGDREQIIGLSKDDILLTKTFTRIFKYELVPDSLPVTADSGLPSPLDYLYYMPSIRNVSLDAHLDKDTSSLYLQYRPTGENN